MKKTIGLSVLFCAAAFSAFTPAGAWGPHPDITRAALAALGTNEPLAKALGDEWPRLADYTWMPDWRRSLVGKSPAVFYADDYLLFPGATNHIGHMAPDVETAWRPYFLRALQALRTESPPNAARWVGALGHFIEDTAAPPHAFPAGGKLHGPMENWIDGKQVGIAGHKPAAPGGAKDDEAAVAEFVQRMRAMESVCRVRGQRIKALVEKEDRPAVEKIALESANDAARMLADVLHTLGGLAPAKTGGAALTGKVDFAAASGLETVPAKVMLAGTSYSTLCDASGAFAFRGLPPGRYRVLAMRPGGAGPAEGIAVELAEGRPASCAVRLEPVGPAGNLVRNADFSLRWVRPDAPDAWHPQKDGWEGEVIPVKPGARYRVDVAWADGAPKGSVVVRWRNTTSPSGGQFETEPPILPGTTTADCTAPTSMTHVRLQIQTTADPRKVCRSVAFRPR